MNQNKSVELSKICTAGFALFLLLLNVAGYWIMPVFILFSDSAEHFMLTVGLELCSVPAWEALWCLWRLLGNLQKGLVFVAENVRYMKLVSRCCFAVSVLCLVMAVVGLFSLIAIIMAGAAAFMGLIVRIVKDAFEQAISMKDELDFTV